MQLSFLRTQFPQTSEALARLSPDDEGAAALRHLLYLDQHFMRRDHIRRDLSDAELSSPDLHPPSGSTFDVAVAGGGLSLIYAAVLARAGRSVCVFDRRRIGCGHREWNISRAELVPLWESGLFTQDEVERLILMQYRTGICRFAGGTDHPVSQVLDCVVDAETLLTQLRERASAAGAVLLDYHELAGYKADSDGVSIVLQPTSESAQASKRSVLQAMTRKPRVLRARLLIDGLGAASPHAQFDLCCPTVGGVMDGLTLGSSPLTMDPQVGEILVTTEGIEDGKQHIWEGFPAPPAPQQQQTATTRMTIYLFYYARTESLARLSPLPLLSLYERFFQTLQRYKSGPLTLVRPTYGYIPAYTRLGNMPASPAQRVLLVGDAAGRHSPLTFCGFGSMIRSFWPIAVGVLRCLREDRLQRSDLAALWTEPPALQVMGGLTLMMSPSETGESAALSDPDGLNRLLDSAFGTLAAMGDTTYGRFLRDDVDAATFVRFMLGAARKHPQVYEKVFQQLSPSEVGRWLWRLFRLWMQS